MAIIVNNKTIDLNALSYIASYPDLMAFFGTDTAAAVQHYVVTGIHENRTITFNALNYIASYPDLMAFFGTDAAAAAQHYIVTGYNEGRTVSFDALKYIASYPDLMAFFGTDTVAATRHYMVTGYNEGRTVSFDPLKYIASYPDLMAFFGTDTVAATQHYIVTGYNEGRTIHNSPPITPPVIVAPSINIINGDAGNNVLTGTANNDIIYPKEGADTVNAGAGNDIIVVIGQTAANQYVQLDISNPAGSGLDLSSVLTLATLNGHTVSDVVAGESIDGGSGTNRLVIYGNVDFTGVTLANISQLQVNSTVTMSVQQLNSLSSLQLTNLIRLIDIIGDGESVLTITNSSADPVTLDLSAIQLTGFKTLTISAGITVIADQADVNTLKSIAGNGTLKASDTSGTLDLTDKFITVSVQNKDGADYTGHGATVINGTISIGSEAPDTLVGSNLADYLDGGAGDDVLGVSSSDVSSTPISWSATVASLNNIEPSENITDVVNNGVLHIPPSLSNTGYYWTHQKLTFPNAIDGDNFKVEARVKNPVSEGGISAYDPGIHVSSSSQPANSFGINFMDGAWAQSYSSIYAPELMQRNLSSLVRSFNDWHTISIETKNHQVTATYDGVVVADYNYSGTVGLIDTLNLTFKGSGSIDWAKAYSNGQMILNDDFNAYSTPVLTHTTTNNGEDTLVGGLDNDTYYVDSIGDTVIEKPDEGTDTVNSSIATYKLTANVENLTLTGTQAIDGLGNDLDNIITGNDKANVLIGYAGNDTLKGGLGNDNLQGGGDTDTAIYSGVSTGYKFEYTNNILKVTDTHSADGDDGIDTLANVEALQFSDKTVYTNAIDIFKTQLIGDEKLIVGGENAGMIRSLADFSKAAYALQTWEQGTAYNDVSDNADIAYQDVLSQGWQPLTLGTQVNGQFSSLDHSHDFGTVSIDNNAPWLAFQTVNGMAGGYYTQGNAAAFVARCGDSIVLSFRGTNDNRMGNADSGVLNQADSNNMITPDVDQWGGLGDSSTQCMTDHYALFNALITAFDAYMALVTFMSQDTA